MSGLGRDLSPEEEAATAAEVAEAAAQGRVRKSALLKLLEVCECVCVRGSDYVGPARQPLKW